MLYSIFLIPRFYKDIQDIQKKKFTLIFIDKKLIFMFNRYHVIF